MICSLCMFSRDEPLDALTVINGQAVCDDHAGYVQGGDHARALIQVLKDEGRWPER